MEFFIVTGMSGAGKSMAVKMLEDMGYYCVDNIPPNVMPAIVEIGQNLSSSNIKRIAVVVDARSREMWGDFNHALSKIDRNAISLSIIFLDASTDVLFSRYRETRRRHPMLDDNGSGASDLRQAIEMERELLANLKEQADITIDTSRVGPQGLREHIMNILSKHEKNSPMSITCLSFGYRNGLPLESDLVFDVRCLPNPFYIPELKEQSGDDPAVYEYIMGFEESQELVTKLKNFLGFSVPLYLKEGKTRLTIAVGCTGGKHRSVAIARQLCDFLLENGYHVRVQHRDKDIAKLL